MANAAIFSLIGVFLGALVAAFGTLYREQITTKREREARAEIEAREKRAAVLTFQRESILALQDAIVATVKSVYAEQDRMLRDLADTGNWSARQWSTPTAQGWSDAQLGLQASRARVFDEEMRAIAGEIRTTARSSIWAAGVEDAKAANLALTGLVDRFHELVAARLRDLY